MKRLERVTVLLSLINRLKEGGSWCGETHIQKTAYFLQELLRVPTNFDFILYKHGPFSFELNDEVVAMRADGFLNLIPQQPYGASLYPSKQIENVMVKFPETVKEYSPQINFVSEKLSSMGVAELERLATALYVINEKDVEEKDRAGRIHKLKPHISIEQANSTLKMLDEIITESKSIRKID